MKVIITQIYDLRLHVDAQIQFNKQKLQPTSETTHSRRSLELAKGWLGKALYFLNETTPYKPADKTENIPETADTVDIKTKYQHAWDEINPKQLNYVNDAREVISHLLQRWEKLNKDYGAESLKANFKDQNNWIDARHALRNTFTHLHEASMNLGFELARLRKQSMKSSFSKTAKKDAALNPNKPIDAGSKDERSIYFTRNLRMELDYDQTQKVSLGGVIAATLINMGREMNTRLERGEDSPFYGRLNPYVHPVLNTKAWIKNNNNPEQLAHATSVHRSE